MLPEPVKSSARTLPVRLSCPKCASTEVRRVTERGSVDAAGLPCPRKHHPVRWVVLAAVSLILAGFDFVGGETERIIFGTSTFVGGWIAIRGFAFNSRDFPHLLHQWERSLVCLSCGETFAGG